MRPLVALGLLLGTALVALNTWGYVQRGHHWWSLACAVLVAALVAYLLKRHRADRRRQREWGEIIAHLSMGKGDPW
jgi:multisubunit Na+/H+ antiporter MnhE subunit